jgi:hypothetical protein
MRRRPAGVNRSLVRMLRCRWAVTRRRAMPPLIPALFALVPSLPPVFKVVVLALVAAHRVISRADQRLSHEPAGPQIRNKVPRIRPIGFKPSSFRKFSV